MRDEHAATRTSSRPGGQRSPADELLAGLAVWHRNLDRRDMERGLPPGASRLRPPATSETVPPSPQLSLDLDERGWTT